MNDEVVDVPSFTVPLLLPLLLLLLQVSLLLESLGLLSL